MYAACWLHRKAQMAPNSCAVPKRRAGMALLRASSRVSIGWPDFCAAPAIVTRRRSVSKAPGSRLLMVTLEPATLLRATPATKPVRPLRAPLLRPSTSIGALTAPEVMFTMRPNPRSAMPSTVLLISAIGVSMLASSALIQCSRSQSRKSPGGGPPALVTTMSNCVPGPPLAANTAARPCAVVMSAATASTLDACAPGKARSPSAAACSTSAPRATTSTCTPSRTSACAQPRPRPLLAPHTSAHLPVIPRSIFCS